MSGTLFVASVALGLLSIVALVTTLVRLVLTRLRTSPIPSTAPPGVTWSSPIVLIPLGLMGVVVAVLVAIVAFWVGCASGPDLC